jgi:hypothetical protein
MDKCEKGGFGGGGDFTGAEETCDKGPMDVIRREGREAAVKGAHHEAQPNLLISLSNEVC